MTSSLSALQKLIQHLQIQTKYLAKESLAGTYHSAFKGKGIEFEEVRPYTPGDEIRTIDWKVTARMDTPYIKRFREERELNVLLAVDLSPSMQCGSTGKLKSEHIAEIAGLLAFSALQNHDQVSLLLFSDTVEKYLPAHKGTRHILRILRELISPTPAALFQEKQKVVQFLTNIQAGHTICFLLTDLYSSIDPLELSLIAKKYDLITVILSDPREYLLPNIGYVTLKDPETEETLTLNSNDPKINAELEKQYTIKMHEQKRLFTKAGSSFLHLSTEENYALALNQFFKSRKRK